MAFFPCSICGAKEKKSHTLPRVLKPCPSCGEETAGEVKEESQCSVCGKPSIAIIAGETPDARCYAHINHGSDSIPLVIPQGGVGIETLGDHHAVNYLVGVKGMTAERAATIVCLRGVDDVLAERDEDPEWLKHVEKFDAAVSFMMAHKNISYEDAIPVVHSVGIDEVLKFRDDQNVKGPAHDSFHTDDGGMA